MLAPSALKVIHVLLSSGEKKFTVRELARVAEVSPASCSRHINKLEKLGYVQKRPKVKVISKELVYLLGYSRPLRSLKSYGFQSLERPQYLIRKIGEISDSHGLTYAYTCLAGAELVAPYLVPDEIHFYINGEQIHDWTPTLRDEGIYPGEGGSIHLLIADLNPFYGAHEVRGLNVVSDYLLFADLYTLGGRAREAARFLADRADLEV